MFFGSVGEDQVNFGLKKTDSLHYQYLNEFLMMLNTLIKPWRSADLTRNIPANQQNLLLKDSHIFSLVNQEWMWDISNFNNEYLV